MLCKQDEFKQWFRAKVHVMSGPGERPFDSLDLQSTTQVANGDLGVSTTREEHHGKLRQPVQVPPCRIILMYHPDQIYIQCPDPVGWF